METIKILCAIRSNTSYNNIIKKNEEKNKDIVIKK